MRRDNIYREHMLRGGIDAIGAAYKYFQRDYNEIYQAKHHQKMYLYEYLDIDKYVKRIDTSVPGVYDIKSLANYNGPVEAISKRKSFYRI